MYAPYRSALPCTVQALPATLKKPTGNTTYAVRRTAADDAPFLLAVLCWASSLKYTRTFSYLCMRTGQLRCLQAPHLLMSNYVCPAARMAKLTSLPSFRTHRQMSFCPCAAMHTAASGRCVAG